MCIRDRHYIREAEQRVEEGCSRAEAFAAAERSLTARICDYVHHANACLLYTSRCV